MSREERFLEIMTDMRARMVNASRMLTKEEISEGFSEFGFTDDKIEEIVSFLATDYQALTAKKTGEEILTEAAEESFSEETSSESAETPAGGAKEEERPNVLKMYLEELGELKETDDTEGRKLLARYMNGDKDVFEQVIEHYLPRVVEIAKIYEGQGVLAEDLIGEGNMALTIGLTMCECSDDATEAEATVIRMIMDAMEGLITEETSDSEAARKAGSLLEEVGSKAEELYKAYGRDVTKEELVEAYEMDPAVIEEAIRVSEGNIEHLKKGGE